MEHGWKAFMGTRSTRRHPPSAADTRTYRDTAVEIQKACDDDIPQLIRLHRVALRQLDCAIYTERQIDSLVLHLPPMDYAPAEIPTYFVARIECNVVCVAGWGLRPAGCKAATSLADAPMRSGGIATICSICTHPNWIRQGIARLLLVAVEEEARAADHRQIEVRALIPAVPLFLACGYAVCGPCRLLLPDGVSLELMQMLKPLVPVETRGTLPVTVHLPTASAVA
jgi:GNAT superfamily N-acetyltransferase